MATATLAVALAASPVRALDARYTDADGDMVADPPTDASQLIDPDRLIFAYTPVEDPAVYAKVWQGFLDHLADSTGKNVQFFPVQSNATQTEAMRAGRLHIAGFNTGSNPLAVACAGLVPFAMMASNKGEFGYEMEIITYPGSGVEKVEDIKGKSSPSPPRGRNPTARRHPCCCARNTGSRPAGTMRSCSRANTTTPCWASRTRTIPRRRSPTRSRNV